MIIELWPTSNAMIGPFRRKLFLNKYMAARGMKFNSNIFQLYPEEQVSLLTPTLSSNSQP